MATDLLDKLKNPDHPLKLIGANHSESYRREGACEIPIDILEQKLILMRGLVCADFHLQSTAKKHFINCLNSGKCYDVRIRKECVEQLQKILIEEGKPSYRLDNLHKSFRHRNRDFIFLVNQSDYIDALSSDQRRM